MIELIASPEAIGKLQQEDDLINDFSKFHLEFSFKIFSIGMKSSLGLPHHVWNILNTTCINRLKLLTLPRRKICSLFTHALFSISSLRVVKSGIHDTLYTTIGFYKISVENPLEFLVNSGCIKIMNSDTPIAMKYNVNLERQGDASNKIYNCTSILYAAHSFAMNFFETFFVIPLP